MRQFKTMKAGTLIVMLFCFLIILIPSSMASIGTTTVQFVINPPSRPINPGVERMELEGFARTTTIGPQYGMTYIGFEIEDTPEWASVYFPEQTLMLKSEDLVNFSVFVSVNENAPAYRDGVINLNVTSGPFFAVQLQGNPPLAGGIIGDLLTFQTKMGVPVKAGYLPLLSSSTPVPKEGRPNQEVHHTITVENTGNAQQLLQFNIDSNKIPSGWSATAPAPVYLNAGDETDISVSVITPRRFGFTDEWTSIPLDITAQSSLEGGQGRTQTYSIPTTTHAVGYFVPGVPGGSNPAVIFGGLGAIIAVIVILVFFAIRFYQRKKQ